MTNTLVKSADKMHSDVSSLLNFAGKQETTAKFGSFMVLAASRTSENQTMAQPVSQTMPHRENRAKEILSRAERATDNSPKLSEAEAKAEAKKEPGESAKATESGWTAEEIDEVVKAAAEVFNTVALRFDLTPEELAEVLTELGLIPESLLDPKMLSEVVLTLEGTDLLNLMTDEVLYENFTELSAEVQPIIDELLKTTELTPEEMNLLINQLQTMETDEASAAANAEALTESVNQANELAKQQMNEPEQKITIVIEKDGVITEITQKADENGNLKATDEVATIKAETEAVLEPKEQSSQNGSGNSGQNTEGYETILNNLLKDQIDSLKPQFDPILEAPDPTQILSQILDFMKIKLSPGIDSLEMQLHPASLGTVGVKITSTAGVITAQFTAQNETVKAAIESQIVELKENMRSQGIKVEAIEVNLESKAFDSKLWQGKDENRQEEQASHKNRRRINLSGLNELPEELTGEEKLAAELMIENGQTVDFKA
ncbi:MAG: flagellar hook-length control protein FliK [Lachnospiraceae bacterium]|nr:flagellar hook-length control protein FliK [Lachnospiraceae bacterium]